MTQELHHVIQMSITFIIWIFYCYYEGIREAYYYHIAMPTSINRIKNLHLLYTIQRFLIIVLSFFACGATFSAMVSVFSFAYMFSFIHDGFYYCKRNDLNPLIYQKRWKDDSTTSTAKTEIKYKGRLIMFICGMTLFTTTIVLTMLKIFH